MKDRLTNHKEVNIKDRLWVRQVKLLQVVIQASAFATKIWNASRCGYPGSRHDDDLFDYSFRDLALRSRACSASVVRKRVVIPCPFFISSAIALKERSFNGVGGRDLPDFDD